MTPLKIPFILADSLWMYLNATAPNGCLPKDEHIIPDWREHFLKSLARPCVALRWVYWTASALEIVMIMTSVQPNHRLTAFITHNLLFKSVDVTAIGQITNWFIVGSILTLLGTLLRLRSYRSLGKYFTFELSLFRDHSLVVTGPYSIIRHPSYTGLILSVIGAFINIFLGGGWASQSGVVEKTVIGFILAVAWAIVAAAVVLSLFLRIPGEDRILHAKFGEEWERWASRVRSRLIPGIY